MVGGPAAHLDAEVAACSVLYKIAIWGQLQIQIPIALAFAPAASFLHL
jgi:hypothetical protein